MFAAALAVVAALSGAVMVEAEKEHKLLAVQAQVDTFDEEREGHWIGHPTIGDWHAEGGPFDMPEAFCPDIERIGC